MNESKRSDSMNFMINMTSCVIYRILQMSVLVWVNQYLLKRLPAEDYSIYPLVLSLVVFGDFFKSIFTSGIARFLVAAHTRGDKVEVTRIASSMFPVLLGVGLAIAAAALVCAWQIDKVIDVDPAYVPQARIMLIILGMLMGVNVATTSFQSGLLVQQDFVTINLIDLGTELLRVTTLLTLLFGVGTEVIWLVVASAAGSLTNTIYQILATRRRMPEIRFDRKLVSRAQVKTLLGFSAWSCTEGFSGVAARSLPVIFLNKFAGATAVTQFHLANLADLQVKGILAAAMRPVMPALTALHALGLNEKLRELYYSGGRYHLWVMLIPAGPILCFATEFMGLYAGIEYREAGIVIIALTLRYPITYASAMYYRIAHASGEIKVYYIVDIILQTIVIAATYCVLRYRGAGAAEVAWWTCIIQCVYYILIVWPLGIRSVNGSWLDFLQKTLIQGCLPLVASVMYCLAFKSLHVPQDWRSMTLACGTGVIVNLVTIGILGFTFSDRALLDKTMLVLKRKFQSLQSRS